MMRTVITPEQVVSIAFGEGNYLSANIVSSADIVAAQDRYLIPIMGQTLLEAVLDGDYEDFMANYVAPAAAFATRLRVQPAINLKLGDSGLVAPRGDAVETPLQSAVDALMLSLRMRTRQLLKRLSNYLNSNEHSFSEYRKEYNILNRCSIDGGFVQIF